MDREAFVFAIRNSEVIIFGNLLQLTNNNVLFCRPPLSGTFNFRYIIFKSNLKVERLMVYLKWVGNNLQ